MHCTSCRDRSRATGSTFINKTFIFAEVNNEQDIEGNIRAYFYIISIKTSNLSSLITPGNLNCSIYNELKCPNVQSSDPRKLQGASKMHKF